MLQIHRGGRRVFTAALAVCSVGMGLTVAAGLGVAAGAGGSPLVISEIVTGGASASDEFIEIHNPTDAPAALDGLELVYVTASGATVSRRAAWTDGAVPARGHRLIVNTAGIFATIGDDGYASGISASGGSVALRRVDDGTVVDVVAWGAVTSSWVEGASVAAPAAGHSIERLPGGVLGSGQDTGDNVADFVERASPEPQNSGSAPTPDTGTDPSPSPAVTPTAGPSPTGHSDPPETPTPAPSTSAIPTPPPSTTPGSTSPTPTPQTSTTPTPVPPLSIAAARSLPDGESVTVDAVALSSSAFTDGGGYVWDGSAGIAVLVTGGTFERGERIRATGILDERFHQRTLRATAVERVGTGADPVPQSAATGSVGEAHEARLVRISGAITAAATALSTGLAFNIDDGSGGVRVLVGAVTGIDTAAWVRGATITLTGVVGQRDSGGTGTAGYRVMPRDSVDVHAVTPPAVTQPSPSPGTARPTATPQHSTPALVSIATARQAAPDSDVRLRGVVTASAGTLVDERTAVIQDATGAIVLRLDAAVSLPPRGSIAEVTGVRSTKGGMQTVRAESATLVGSATEPAPVAVSTGPTAAGASESHEARVVIVRGIAESVRTSSAGNVSLTIDDGTGPLRAFAFASTGIPAESLASGAWIEVRGILGQETSGDRPSEGYRVWPRDAADVRVVAPATDSAATTGDPADADGSFGPGDGGEDGASGSAARPQDLSGVLDPANAAAGGWGRATLVAAAWPEIEAAGVLWDGTAAVVIDDGPAPAAGVRSVLGDGRPPVVVEVTGAASPQPVGLLDGYRIALDADEALRAAPGTPAPPAEAVPDGAAAWVRVAGTLERRSASYAVTRAGVAVEVMLSCRDNAVRALWEALDGDAVFLDGLAGTADGEAVMLVPCTGVAAAPIFEPPPARNAGRPLTAPDAATAEPQANTERAQASSLLAAAGAVTTALTGLVGTVAWRRGTLDRLLRVVVPGQIRGTLGDGDLT